MSYWTECDWCGRCLEGEDHAEMRVTIHRTKGRTELQAAWAKEVKQTRHFCVMPKDVELDDSGSDRMGMAPTESGQKSCYNRAIDAMTGSPITDPGKGYEWRLVSVEEEHVERPPARTLASRFGSPEECAAPDSVAIRQRAAAGTFISEAGITPRARHALIGADIVTLEEVAGRSEHELLALEGVGHGSIEQIGTALASHGLPPLKRDLSVIGERLRTLRLSAGLTHDGLARQLSHGIYGRDVQAWEHGRKAFDTVTAARLAEVLNVSVDELLVREAKVA
jgi:DNA-binding transcriptional regulator YiaG